MNIQCQSSSSFCSRDSNDNFLSKLESLNLVPGPHQNHPKPLTSFLNVFSEFLELPIDRLESLMGSLVFNQNSNNLNDVMINPELRALLNQALRIEYDLQRSWLSLMSCPNLAALLLCSDIGQVDIYVICGTLPMYKFHKGSQVVLISSALEAGRASKFVVGLGGLGVFHSIVQPNNETYSWEIINSNAVRISPRTISFFENERIGQIVGDDELQNPVDEDDEGAEEVSINDFDLSEADADDSIRATTISSFIQLHSTNDGATLKIRSSAYSDESSKIDFAESQNEDVDLITRRPRINQTFDFDGIFMLLNSNQFANSIKGTVSTIKPVPVNGVKNIRSIKKSVRDLNGVVSEFMAYFSIGSISTSFGLMNIVLCVGTNPVENVSISKISFQDLVARAMIYAREAPCINPNTGEMIHMGCECLSLRATMNSSRPADLDRIVPKSFFESYQSAPFKCFLYHFQLKIAEFLSGAGIVDGNIQFLVRSIGTKFSMTRENVLSMFECISELDCVFELKNIPSNQISIDFCVVSTAISVTGGEKLSMFWRSQAVREFLELDSASYYPQLFSMDAANVHSNVPRGKYQKVNVYNCFIDLLQIDFTANPVKFLNIASMIVQEISELNFENIPSILENCLKSLKLEMHSLLQRFTNVRGKNSALRAEFRISFNDLAAMILLISEKFNPVNILSNAFILKTSTVCDLSRFYSTMLFVPIFKSIFRVVRCLERGDRDMLHRNVATISLFESLWCKTLFEGGTHSYAREMVWASKDNQPDSFDVMYSLKSLNRPVFSPEKMDLTDLIVCDWSEELFDGMFFRLSRKKHTSDSFVQIIKLCSKVYSPTVTLSDKCYELWMAYYGTLPCTDFLIDTIKGRWLRRNLSGAMNFCTNSIPLGVAVDTIFNLFKFESNAWKRPYLRAFWILIKKLNYVERDVKTELIRIAKDILKIEIIRYHGDKNSFYAKGSTCVNIVFNEHAELVPSIMEEENSEEIDQIGRQIILNSAARNTNIIKKHGIGTLFSEREDVDLMRGINTFGFKWTLIRDHPSLIFASMGIRTATMLSSRYHNHRKYKRIRTDGYLIYLDNLKHACRPLDNIENASLKRSRVDLGDFNEDFETIESPDERPNTELSNLDEDEEEEEARITEIESDTGSGAVDDTVRVTVSGATSGENNVLSRIQPTIFTRTQVVDVVKSVYGNENYGFYLKWVIKLPESFDDVNSCSWSQIHSRCFSAARKNIDLWNQLFRELSNGGMIQQDDRRRVIRIFPNFTT